MTLKVWAKMVFSLLTAACSMAAGISLETLPEGVRSPQLRFGVVNGLDQSYGSDGYLWSLGDLHSINFDAATLAAVNPDANTLIRALNAFGSQNLGKDINLGTLVVDTRPEVRFQAAIFAFGKTNNWTLALAVPFIHYQNSVSLSSRPGNLEFYRSQFQGQSASLDRALNINIVSEAQKSIAAKGYSAIADRDQKFIGDIQLVSIYRFTSWNHPAIYQSALVLPTGPRENPDDLLAINQFHRTELKNLFALGFDARTKTLLKPYVSLTVPLPEAVSKRVPLDESDSLPDQSQTQNLTRLRGPTGAIGAQLEQKLDRQWTVEGGYEYASKARDSFKGDQGGRYDLLADQSDSLAQRAEFKINYSTVQTYLAKESILPMQVSLTWSDTIGGRNINREQMNELNLMMFF